MSDNRCPGDAVNAEDLAKTFHQIYEHLAPLFGYKTNIASAVPWEKVPENNRKLMIETCQHVLQQRFHFHVGNYWDPNA